MASIGFLIGGALVDALAFTGSNYLFSNLSKESIDRERKRHDKATFTQCDLSPRFFCIGAMLLWEFESDKT